MSDWPTPRMRTAADMAAMDAAQIGGPLHGVVQAAVTAALDAAPTVDGWVWCDHQMGVDAARGDGYGNCPGPHRTLIIGPEVTS